MNYLIYPISLPGETSYQTFCRWLNHCYDDNNPEYGVPYCTGYGKSHGRCWISVRV